MSKTDQTPLGIGFLQLSQMKASKTHVVFDVSKDNLNYGLKMIFLMPLLNHLLFKL